jgi:hypothetical protein
VDPRRNLLILNGWELGTEIRNWVAHRRMKVPLAAPRG